MANKLNTTSLDTERLQLRLPEMTDAIMLQRLINDWEIAVTTATIPHPYDLSMAEAMILRVQERPEDVPQFNYMMIQCVDNQLVGGCGFSLNLQHESAEIGYWVGKPYWGNGYATEATRRLIEFCFSELQLNRVQASYFVGNRASRRVMEKAGMRYEATLRQAMIRDIPAKNHRVYHDVGYCAILRSDWDVNRD